MEDTVLSVSEFVSLLNQTLEFAYPSVTIEGEVSEFRISKDRWVYMKLQDKSSSVQLFGTVHMLQQPIQDGMRVRVRGAPKLHNRYGFSVNIRSITPAGEGDIKKAFELLKAKLSKEGLFDLSRKRSLPEFPARLGIISSAQAAGYKDFLKIIDSRWGGLELKLADVQVQGEPAPAQIVSAIEYFNQLVDPPDILVITRGGGSLEDLMAFNSESVVRAIIASRTPTVVGVGHEIDITLAGLAADVRAATPTDAARLVVPDKHEFANRLKSWQQLMQQEISNSIASRQQFLRSLIELMGMQLSKSKEIVDSQKTILDQKIDFQISAFKDELSAKRRLLTSFDPKAVLKRGYSIVRSASGQVIYRQGATKIGDRLMLELSDGNIEAEVTNAKD